MKNRTKQEIVDDIFEKIGPDVSKADILKVINLFLDEVKQGLENREKIELRGFGTFELRLRKGRENARNPKTGETVSMDSHYAAVFRAGQELKENLQGLKET
ncbi:MAG: integration host factor subunit beta [Treponema sp.]|nr:integration host factor subunit beta [Treponema sp.]